MIIADFNIVAYRITRPERIKRNEKYRDIEAEILGDIFCAMMNADNGSPSKCLFVQAKTVNLEHLKDEAGSYLVFGFRILNASGFNVKIGREPTGHVMFDKQELAQTLEFVLRGLKPTLKRIDETRIELRQ